MDYIYNKFAVPDASIDFLTIEQAALNNATIITPIYDGNFVGDIEQYIQELGLNCADGSKIQVIDWEEWLKDEGNEKTGDSIVLYQPMDIIHELFYLDSYENVIFIESNNT